VYITSYNHREFLCEAIESVIEQSRKPDEVIIIDDCSRDGSQDMISDYQKRYPNLIKMHLNDKNGGIAQVRNIALNLFSGEALTGLDGDDKFLPTKIEKELNVLEDSDVDLVYSNSYWCGPDGSINHVWLEKPEIAPEGDTFLKVFGRDFPRNSLFRSEMVKASKLKTIGFYDTELPIYEDWDMRIRMSKQLKFAYCDAPLSIKRDNPEGLSKSKLSLHIQIINYIVRKNFSLLEDVSIRERRVVLQRIGRLLSGLASVVLRQDASHGSYARSLKFGLWALYYRYLYGLKSF